MLADLPDTQCAAVTTQVGEMRDPPHPGLPLKSISICQGHAPFKAFTPAMTLPCLISGTPQFPKNTTSIFTIEIAFTVEIVAL